MPDKPPKRKHPEIIPERASAIAAHFKRTRLELMENQTLFAKRMGLSQNNISNIEHGLLNPRLSTMEEWAFRLCMDVADLIRDPKKRPPG